jgi:hypothetical protein
MPLKSLLLSTPDLRHNPLLQHIKTHYEYVFSPKLRPIEGYPSNPIETQIAALHQKILQDQQKRWYQNISISAESLENHPYPEILKPILEQIEQKDCLLHDPLLVHLLQLWLTNIESPSIILYYSDPMECAHALQKAWRFPLAFGLALWEHYVLTACRNLKNYNCILISSNKLRSSAKNHLEPILNDLGIAQPDDWSVFSQTELSNHSEQAAALQQNQKHIFTALEENDLSSLYDLTVSDESHDILEYYGQLRSGFETVKAERDKLRSELGLGQNKIKIRAVEPTVTEGSLDNAEGSLDNAEGSFDNAEGSFGNAEGSFGNAEGSLCKVRVHIEGMEMLEFYADPSSPVLDMLRNHLVSTEQDELIYLHYGDNENDTLYFMSSNLLGMETEPANQH